MTKLIYICTTRDNKTVKVKTLAEARAIRDAGGSYKASYVPIKDLKEA